MPRRSVFAFAVLLVLALSPAVHGAVADYFLKIDGIEGESKDKGHGGWIELNSFQWAVGRTGAAGAARACSVGDIVVIKETDKTSPILRGMSGGTRTIPQAILEDRGERHLLQNVKVVGQRPAVLRDGSAGEELTLQFARCATHAAAPAAASGKHFPKVELTMQAQGSKPILIGLLLPAVQKVREAAHPRGPVDARMLDFQIVAPGRAKLVLVDGSEASTLLRTAFGNQHKLEFMEMTRPDKPHAKIVLRNVLISSYQTGASADVVPTDQVSMNFSKVEAAHKTTTPVVTLQLNFSSMEGNPAAIHDVFLK